MTENVVSASGALVDTLDSETKEQERKFLAQSDEDTLRVGASSDDDDDTEEPPAKAAKAVRNATSSPALPRTLVLGRARTESSLQAVAKQLDPEVDTPAPSRPARGRGRGGSRVMRGRSAPQIGARGPPPAVLKGDLSDIKPPERVGEPMYEYTKHMDSVERGMQNRRVPLSRESSILDLTEEERGELGDEGEGKTAWPSLGDKRDQSAAGEYLEVIQQDSATFARVIAQMERANMSKLCREVDALLQDFLIHVCNLADRDVFLNYKELQNGIHEVIGAMARDVVSGPVPRPHSETSSKFMRPTGSRVGVGEQINMSLLEFLRKVPDRLLQSRVLPLHTVAKRLGADSALHAELGAAPDVIYRYMIFHTVTDENPHNLAAVLMAELCRLIASADADDPSLRFRVTIGTVIFYGALRVIDIAEEQIKNCPAQRAGVTNDYPSAAIRTGIVKQLCSISSGQMRVVCDRAIEELIRAARKNAVSAASASSSSAPVVAAQIGHQRSVLSDDERDAILARKAAAELGTQPDPSVERDSITAVAYLREDGSAAMAEKEKDGGWGGCAIS